MFLGISGIVWLLLGVVGAIVLTVLIAQRTSQYGGARLMFLAPAGFVFTVFVLYPILGSIWLSLHDVRADDDLFRWTGSIGGPGRSDLPSSRAEDGMGRPGKLRRFLRQISAVIGSEPRKRFANFLTETPRQSPKCLVPVANLRPW